MRSRLTAAVVCCFVLTVCLSAQDDVFLSLTRKPTPMKDLPVNITNITSEQIQESHSQSLGDVLNSEGILT